MVVVGIALWEEMAFRSYLIKNLAEGLNWKAIGPRWATAIAILIPSVLFGWIHSTNENATALSTANTMLFGVVFGAAYALTGELALPLGLHFAWDFVQAFVFGRGVDAANLGAFLIVAEGDPAARLLTGFPYTVEGGLLGTAMLLVGFLLVLVWVRLKDGIRPIGVHHGIGGSA
jgi:hypothetical protein